MPGIANLSRLEHVVGVAYLATQTGIWPALQRFDQLAFAASALLHDWAITAFGHLVEEALQYVGTRFDHEERLAEIAAGGAPDEIGGVARQILVGRETGLAAWLKKVAGADGDRLLVDITEHIRGRGTRGGVIAGSIDLDNIDNVYRMAFHMGLSIERQTPRRLASSIVGARAGSGAPVFRTTAKTDIAAWRATRREVYQHLMLAEKDFVGKTMIIAATVNAFEDGEIAQTDWALVDFGLVARLLDSRSRSTRETIERWIAGELWACTPLKWMSGERPEYSRLRAFSRDLTEALGRPCFAYGIKDKRDRRLEIFFDDGSTQQLGENPNRWLLGIGSSKRQDFTSSEVRIAFGRAQDHFGSRVLSTVVSQNDEDAQSCLL